MKKWISFIAVFSGLCLAGHGSVQAGGTSLHVGIGYGTEESTAYDLSIQHTFEPWYAGQTVSLSPLVLGGVSAWGNGDDASTMWGANLGVGLSLDFVEFTEWRPFASVSVGGALISRDDYGKRELGSHGQFRSQGSIGFKFGESLRHILKIDATHYSNAGLADDNDAYNSIGLSYGFTF